MSLTLSPSSQPKERKGSRFLTEIRAGVVSFFAMAYILAVNSSIVSDSGGTCVCTNPTAEDPFCAVDPAYMLCKNEIKRDLITGTAAISALTTFFLGLLANMFVDPRLRSSACSQLIQRTGRLEFPAEWASTLI
jgi:AGZA family xanthine/uracil permease-like MFS transporter